MEFQLGRESRPRVSRPSIRPSAFGIPRSSMVAPRDAAPSEQSSAAPSPRISSIPSSLPSEPPRVSQTVRKRIAPEHPPVKTDIEELLPISQGVKSLPRPPRLPTFEAPSIPAPTTRRFPWMSLSIFAVVLGASLAPLARYRVERSTPSLSALSNDLREVDWSTLAPVARTLWGEPAQLRDALLEEGERALAAEDALGAESAFTRALALGADDPSAAFGLARARLVRGDAVGARAWAQDALERRPEEPRYRAFLERVNPRHAKARRTP